MREWSPDYLPNAVVAEDYVYTDTAHITVDGGTGVVTSWCSRNIGNANGRGRCATASTASGPTLSPSGVSFSAFTKSMALPGDSLAYTMNRWGVVVANVVTTNGDSNTLLRVNDNSNRQPVIYLDPRAATKYVYGQLSYGSNGTYAAQGVTAGLNTGVHIYMWRTTAGISYASSDCGAEGDSTGSGGAFYGHAASGTGVIGGGLTGTIQEIRLQADELDQPTADKICAYYMRLYGVATSGSTRAAVAAYVASPALIDTAALPEVSRPFPTQLDGYNSSSTSDHTCGANTLYGPGGLWDCTNSAKPGKDASYGSAIDRTGLVLSYLENFDAAADSRDEATFSAPNATGTGSVYSPAIDPYSHPNSGDTYFVKSACAQATDGTTTWLQLNLTKNSIVGGVAKWNVCSVQSVNKKGAGFAQAGGGLFEWRVRVFQTGDGGAGTSDPELWPAAWLKGQTFYTMKADPYVEGDVLEDYTRDHGGANFHTTWFIHSGDAVQPYRGDVPYDRSRSYQMIMNTRDPWKTAGLTSVADGNWHILSCRVDAALGYAITYLDGSEVGRMKMFKEMVLEPLYMISTLTLNTNEFQNAAGPYRMDVDWMRAYRIPASEAVAATIH